MHAFHLLLLASGLLVFFSLLAGVFSARLGLSFLLVFLVAGMLIGVDGPGGVRFDDTEMTAWVGNAALAVILLEGGISTTMASVRSALRPALLLATVGVVLTAVMVGVVAMGVLALDWRHAVLLGAVMASTDAAAVFSLLRHAGIQLPERVSSTLELESGLNDPMAVFLTLAAIAAIQSQAGGLEVALLFVKQAGFGAAIGLAGGGAVAWLLNRMTLTAEHSGLLALIVLSGGLAMFAMAGLVEGSGFLAVYLFGLRVRARAEAAAHGASSALDGFAWAAQASLFLLLGLLVSPRQMLEMALPTLAVVGVLLFVARPLAVWLCLAPLRFPAAQRLFIGWVGLRGAVPIVLALFPLMAHVPGSYRFFNVAFGVVLASLLLQGISLRWVAHRLGVVEPPALPAGGERAVQGRLTLDAQLPLQEVFSFFQLPVPHNAGPTLGDWMTDALARGHAQGDGVDWHGAFFEVAELADGRATRVGIVLRPRDPAADEAPRT